MKPQLPIVIKAPIKVLRIIRPPTPERHGESTWEDEIMDVEVLTIHLEKNTMRVRYQLHDERKGKMVTKTADISAGPLWDSWGLKHES